MTEEQMAIARCKKGQSESYKFLVDKYKSRAYHAALILTGNAEEALDMSQEAFYRAYKAIGSFDLEKNFYTWFYRILKNLCINHFHRRKKRSVSFSDIEEKAGDRLFASDTPKPDEIFEANEMREKLWEAINQLKPQDKEIIILKEFNEFSYKELAEALDIPIGSVMSRLYYARQRLSQLLLEELA